MPLPENLGTLSAGNPRLKGLTRLARKAGVRAERSALLVEGPILLGAAIAAGAEVQEVYVDAATVERPGTAEVLDRLDPEVGLWSVPAGALDRVGDVTASQGLIAVVARTEAAWPEPDRAPFVLLLDDVADPGNVGTLIRAAAATGAATVIVCGGADPTAPKVVRASAGAVFGLDVVRGDAGPAAVERMRTSGYRVLGSVVDGGTSYHEAQMRTPIVLVVGNEARGISAQVLDAVDDTVSIEMAGPTESLNAAMAGTLLCFEVLRRSSS